MAGIYIHIPFCRQACSYCDFHFSTSLQLKDEMLQAIRQEILLSQDYLSDKKLETIYFGGGTPSLLTADDINIITDSINQLYDLSALKEITLEANPDDLSKAYLRSLQHTVINRLSIGIQSFQDTDLKLMNRAHTASDAEYCIKSSQDAGFERLSCDLIFGTPTLSNEQLKNNIRLLASWEVRHISAYSLTIEDRTILAHKMRKGTFTPATEEVYESQMLIVMEELRAKGYEQYEISNYAKDQQYAVHNTNYWKQIPYLGIGPSAHSYNGNSRRWNVRNNTNYIKALLQDKTIPYEEEALAITDIFNETIMTSLRTQWGLNIAKVDIMFGAGYKEHILKQATPFIESGKMYLSEDTLYLSDQGKLIADAISSDLFLAK